MWFISKKKQSDETRGNIAPRSDETKPFKFVVFIGLCIGCIFIFVFLFPLLFCYSYPKLLSYVREEYLNSKNILNLDSYNNFLVTQEGFFSYVSGILSTISIIAILFTIYQQKKTFDTQIEKQDNIANLDRFEQVFYNMLPILDKKISDMSISSEKKYYTGKNALFEIFDELYSTVNYYKNKNKKLEVYINYKRNLFDNIDELRDWGDFCFILIKIIRCSNIPNENKRLYMDILGEYLGHIGTKILYWYGSIIAVSRYDRNKDYEFSINMNFFNKEVIDLFNNDDVKIYLRMFQKSKTFIPQS